MSGLFANARFPGFGPDPLRSPVDSPPFEHVVANSRTQLRKSVRKLCPRLPGVYGMLDERSRLIYVGKAKSLRSRLLSYFLRASREQKAGRIIDHTRCIVWEPGDCEFAALVRELELIRRWKPRYNVQGQPDCERQIYLCLGRTPAPHVYVTREPSGRELACYGPIKGARLAHEAARRLNDLFRLRDCPQTQAMHFSDQRELFPILRTAACLRYELNTCLGPCAGYTSRSNYGRHVRALRAFLDGTDVSPLRKLEVDMNDAALRLDYERAAALRDKIHPLRWLRERLGWVDAARERHSCVYPQLASNRTTIWYLIRRGQVCAAVAEPTNAPTARAAVEALGEVYSHPKTCDRLVPHTLIDHVLLVAAWFRKYPEEAQKSLGPAQAAAICSAAMTPAPLVRSA